MFKDFSPSLLLGLFGCYQYSFVVVTEILLLLLGVPETNQESLLSLQGDVCKFITIETIYVDD